jgi:PKD repeat protein
MIARRSGPLRTRSRPHALSAALALALAIASCDRVPLTAPTQSTIQLFKTASSVPLNGSIDILASVTEQAGTPVQNGTLVSFTTTLGRMDPSEARTTNGKVTVKLVAGAQSGTATVTAFSGAAESATVDVPVGAGAANTISVSASPANVSANGGTVQIIAVVQDEAGNGLSGVPVTFSTTAGTLSSTNATTNSSGQAQVSLTTTTEATVTARAGSASETVTVGVSALPTISISVSPTSPIEDQPATFTITVTPASSGNAIRSVRLDFGDGDFEDLGAVSGTTTQTHTYGSDGSKTVTVTATDSAGQTASQSVVIEVINKTPIGVVLSFSPDAPAVNTVITFNAEVTLPTGVTATQYAWNFGDGSTKVTTGAQTTKSYSTAGTKHVTVTVTGSDGSTGVGAGDIVISP